MEKQAVIDFFDRCAPWWDDDMIRNEDIIATILTLGGIKKDIHVLDVACGTGVLFPDYQSRGVASVTGIDISPEMAKIAQQKHPDIRVICGDVEQTEFDRQFDAVMIYNAFPHFPNPAKLIEKMALLTKPGGRFSVAHSMSRAALTQHHKRAQGVSIDLLHEQELSQLMSPWFDVDVMISTSNMYQVSGIRKDTDPVPQPISPTDELMAMLKYTVNHNDAHAQELSELASQLLQKGNTAAYRQIMDAIAGFDVANAQLTAALKICETK